MALKATSKFRLSTWLRQNVLQMEHYFSLNGIFSMMTSLNDDITLKFPLHCILRKHFLIMKTHFWKVNLYIKWCLCRNYNYCKSIQL